MKITVAVEYLVSRAGPASIFCQTILLILVLKAEFAFPVAFPEPNPGPGPEPVPKPQFGFAIGPQLQPGIMWPPYHQRNQRQLPPCPRKRRLPRGSRSMQLSSPLGPVPENGQLGQKFQQERQSFGVSPFIMQNQPQPQLIQSRQLQPCPPCPYCAQVYHPICASDGQTYRNSCLFNCARTCSPELEVLEYIECGLDPLPKIKLPKYKKLLFPPPPFK